MMQTLMMYATLASLKLKNLFSNEKGEVNVVAIVVLIGVAVLLAILFKDEISRLLTDLLAVIRGKAENAVTNP